MHVISRRGLTFTDLRILMYIVNTHVFVATIFILPPLIGGALSDAFV